jgi:DNA-directed RNA polymerase specialized sigma24 family protein
MVRVLDALRQSRLEDRSRLGAFARGIAHRVIVDMQRARARMIPLAESDQRLAVPDQDALALRVFYAFDPGGLRSCSWEGTRPAMTDGMIT